MKKVFVSLCMTSALIGLSSCGSTKNMATLSNISGEWNIIEINGTAVVPAPGQKFPFIGFDTANGKIYGNSGCNNMMGSFDTQAKAGTIDLGALGSTRMACPDMTVESNVLSALAQVKKYKVIDDTNIALCGNSNRPIVVLQKKAAETSNDALNGKWMITEVFGKNIPTNMENQPFVEFNTAEKKLHGNAGCNLINGSYDWNETNPTAISFPQVATTMMACPDSNVESSVLKALNETKRFGELAGGGIGLYDGADNLIMVLSK